jgi:hypothetical protein
LSGVSLVILPLVGLGRWASESPGILHLMVSIGAGATAMLLVGSIGEWLVHRYAMHGSRQRFALFRLATDLHQRAHHWVHFTPDRYIHDGGVEYPSVLASTNADLARTSFGRVLTVASHAAFYTVFGVPLVWGAWALTSNLWFAGAAGVSTVVLIYLFIRVHDAVHYPGASRLEHFRWFWFLDKHHYIHHIDNEANTNFLLPLGDLLFGTLRRELTEVELSRWPSYEDARCRLFDPSTGQLLDLRERHAPRQQVFAAPVRAKAHCPEPREGGRPLPDV